MAITTWASVQNILELAAGKETIVNHLIPLVEEDYKNIRNKDFDLVTKMEITSAATTAGDITITIDEFEYEIEVEAGDTVQTVANKIAYGLRSVYRKITVDGVVIYFDDLPRRYEANVSERSFQSYYDYPPVNAIEIKFDGGSTGAEATVTRHHTNYPDGAEMTAIQMIQFQLNTKKYAGVTSESLGDYSVTYDKAGASLYPPSITKSIKRYVKFT